MHFKVLYRSTPILLKDASPLTSNNQWKCRKAPDIYLRQNSYPDSFPSQIPALAILSFLFWYGYSKRKCAHFTITDTFVVVGWLPAFPLPLLPSNTGNTGVWLLPFRLQTEKKECPTYFHCCPQNKCLVSLSMSSKHQYMVASHSVIPTGMVICSSVILTDHCWCSYYQIQNLHGMYPSH